MDRELSWLCWAFFSAPDQDEHASVPRQHSHLYGYSIRTGADFAQDNDREKWGSISLIFKPLSVRKYPSFELESVRISLEVIEDYIFSPVPIIHEFYEMIMWLPVQIVHSFLAETGDWW